MSGLWTGFLQGLFWLSVIGVLYTYAGYPLLLAALGRRQPVFRQAQFPSVSIVMAAHNEERNLPRKLACLRALRYPADKLQVVIASDGSTDDTNAILGTASEVVSTLLSPAVGKAAALNHAVRHAAGDILVFLDVRQTLDPDAITELVGCLADPAVGAVSGELLLEDEAGQPSADGLGVYWKLEKFTRKIESATGSVVGVTGAIYAMRRELFQPIPPGTLLDDVLIPMQVARQGKRVIFHPGAVARDRVFLEPGKEFQRKVRTLTGNYQLLQLAPWLLSSCNPLLLRLIGHKLLRLVMPLLLVLLVLCSALLVRQPFFAAVLVLQVAFYAASGLGQLVPATRRQRLIGIAYTFVMLNVAATAAFYNFAVGRARWA